MSAAQRIAAAELLLDRAQGMIESWVAQSIECFAELSEVPGSEFEPIITEHVLTQFAIDIQLVRDMRRYLGTLPSPDPDWFDELIEGSGT